MCLVQPGRVLAIDGVTATVDLDGRIRRASLLLGPEVAPRDWVLVAAGTVLRRLEADDDLELAEAIRAALRATDGRATTDADPGGFR